ncbi:hypothetical protein DH86_00003007, partial [Scytalidium sp. 3C]
NRNVVLDSDVLLRSQWEEFRRDAVILLGPLQRPSRQSSRSQSGTEQVSSSPIKSLLGQGRVDPFQTYPIPFESFIPELVDHYLRDMAIDLPELDAGTPGLLRTRWFPLCMTEEPIFRVIMLLAASHYSCLRYPLGDGPNLLRLKSRAIASINRALQSEDHATSDQLIGAVAKMASYEAMYGEQTAFEWHMNGLMQ